MCHDIAGSGARFGILHARVMPVMYSNACCAGGSMDIPPTPNTRVFSLLFLGSTLVSTVNTDPFFSRGSTIHTLETNWPGLRRSLGFSLSLHGPPLSRAVAQGFAGSADVLRDSGLGPHRGPREAEVRFAMGQKAGWAAGSNVQARVALTSFRFSLHVQARIV